MSRRELTLSIIALIMGIAVGFAGNAALEGTASDTDKNDNERRSDTRVLYRVDVDEMETFLLDQLDEESQAELIEELSARFDAMREYNGPEDFTTIFGEQVEESNLDVVLAAVYAELSDQASDTLEELSVDDSNDALQVIIGEWADPYDLDGASLQFYLKVPQDMAKELPKDWETLDKSLDTHIFWNSLRGIPELEGQS